MMLSIFSFFSLVATVILIIVAKMKIKLIRNPLINRSVNKINLMIYRMIIANLVANGCLLIWNVTFMYIVKGQASYQDKETLNDVLSYGGVGLLTFLYEVRELFCITTDMLIVLEFSALYLLINREMKSTIPEILYEAN